MVSQCINIWDRVFSELCDIFWGQDFLDIHLARVPITHNQEGTMEMGEDVLSSVGAQDLDTSIQYF